jgi:putative ubiquitin-RnfH superfamily antitoxin RatB of RatAB toxin-antitoxin module
MRLAVSVAVALPDRQDVTAIEVEEGATVADAIAAARVVERFPELAGTPWRAGIWSKPCELGAVLRAGDRVEIYRALAADPKDQRRARARLRTSTRSRSGP